MDSVAEALKDRTKTFALSVFGFCETLPDTPEAQALRRQLTRSAMGVVGNYRSACRARSHAEFTARLGLVLDESDESELWLSVIDDRKLSTSATLGWLLAESRQLRAIFSKAFATAKRRDR